MSAHILIIDDDPLLCRSVSFHLEDAGYTTRSVHTVQDAFTHVETNPPDLVLLDIGLPDMNGLDALRILRQNTRRIPTIFVTARNRRLDEILGLELGADDYVIKPFDIDVLLARVRTVLRRTSVEGLVSHLITVGDLVIDPITHHVKINGQPIDLPAKEFQILLFLAQNASKTVSIDELLEAVWGKEWVGESQTVYVHIRWLREKIEQDPANPKRLITIRGAGYKLIPMEEHKS